MEANQNFIKASSDNPILFTVEMYMLMREQSMYDENDRDRLAKAIDSLIRDENGIRYSGLYNRRPGADDRKQQHDDYVAIAAASALWLREPSRDILAYANDMKAHTPWYLRYIPYAKYCYDNTKPYNWDYRFLRQPFDVAVYKEGAQATPDILGCIHFYFKLIFQELRQEPDETSSRLLSWLRIEATKHRWYMKPAKWLFNYMLKSKYENGIEDLMKIYHGNDSYHHRMAKGVKYVR